MKKPPTKRKVMKMLNLPNHTRLAAHFGVTRQAAQKWEDNKPLPFEHQFRCWREDPARFPEPVK